jgi:hypothetical protein
MLHRVHVAQSKKSRRSVLHTIHLHQLRKSRQNVSHRKNLLLVPLDSVKSEEPAEYLIIPESLLSQEELTAYPTPSASLTSQSVGCFLKQTHTQAFCSYDSQSYHTPKHEFNDHRETPVRQPLDLEATSPPCSYDLYSFKTGNRDDAEQHEPLTASSTLNDPNKKELTDDLYHKHHHIMPEYTVKHPSLREYHKIRIRSSRTGTSSTSYSSTSTSQGPALCTSSNRQPDRGADDHQRSRASNVRWQTHTAIRALRLPCRDQPNLAKR